MNVPQIGTNFEISGYTAVQCTGDPAKDAKNFADANNLSLDEAKAILSGQFGAPKAQNETMSTATTQSTVSIDSNDEDAELIEEEDENFTENVNSDDEGITQEDIDAINSAIDSLTEKNTEYKNCFNNYAKSSYEYGLSELYQSINNYQTDAYNLIDAIDSADLSNLDYSTRKDIDNTKDELKNWADKYTKSRKAWAANGWSTSGTAWDMLCTAYSKMRKYGNELISKLQSAGL